MIQPSVSIIIPVFNSEKYISSCLNSLLTQDYPKEKIEIIVVDNASTDKSIEIAKKFNIKIFHVPTGENISTVRNTGANNATGEIFAFIDSDCLAPTCWLKVSTKLLKETEIAAVGCWYSLPDNASCIEKIWDINSQKRREIKGRTTWLASSNFIIKRKVFNEIKGFKEDLVTSEDVDISDKIANLGLVLFSSPELSVIHLNNPTTITDFYLKEKWRGEGVIQRFFSEYPNLKWNNAIIFAFLTLIATIGIIFGLLQTMYMGNSSLLVISTLLIFLTPICLSLKAINYTKKWKYFIPLLLLYLLYAVARISSLSNKKIWLKLSQHIKNR